MLPSTPHFLWVTEFPLFSCHDGEKEFLTRGRRWSSTHHPFTAPMYEDIQAFYAGDYRRVRGQHYDLVLNGVEIGGGSVRIHDSEMQEYVFREVLQVSTISCPSIHHSVHIAHVSVLSPGKPHIHRAIGPMHVRDLIPAADASFSHLLLLLFHPFFRLLRNLCSRRPFSLA